MTPEIRHVNTISLILDPYIDVPKSTLSQRGPPCRTGLYFGPNATSRRGAQRGCTLKRGHLARLSRAVQIFWPKGHAYTKKCEPHSTSIAGGTGKLGGSTPVTAADVNQVPVVDRADCRVTEETSDAIINSGPSPDTLSGSEPQSFFCEPGVDMLGEPRTLMRPPPNVQPSECVVRLDSLDESAKSTASAQSPAVSGLSPLPDMRGRGASQRLEQRLRLDATKASPSTATDIVGRSNVQRIFLRHPPIILRVCYAGLRNVYYSGRPVDVLRIGHRRASLRLPSTARRIRTITSTLLPSCYSPSSRCLPFETAGGFANTITPTAWGIRIIQSPEGCEQMHQALPPISSATCCYAIRLRLGQLRSVLALGESCFHTPAWDSDTSTGASGFGRALHSGDSPNGIYSNSSDWNERSVGSNPEWTEQTNLVMRGRSANFRNTSSLFDGRPAASASTPSYDPVNTTTPQQRDSTLAPPIPLPTFEPSHQPHTGSYSGEVLSGGVHGRPWSVLAATGSAYGQRNLYHTAPSPLNSQGQYDNAFQPEQFLGLSYDASNEPDVRDRSMGMHCPIGGVTARPEHRAPAFDPVEDHPVAGQTPSAEWISGDQQLLCDLIPSGNLSANALNIALLDTTPAIPEPIVPSESTQISVVFPNTCPVCNRVFRRPYILRDHMASRHGQHGQAKLHPCEYTGCTSAYTSQSNLRRHWSQKHASAANSLIPPNSTNDADGADLLVEPESLGTMGSQSLAQYPAEPPLPPVEERPRERTWEGITVQLAGSSLDTTNGFNLQFVDDAVADRGLSGAKLAHATSRTKRRKR